MWANVAAESMPITRRHFRSLASALIAQGNPVGFALVNMCGYGQSPVKPGALTKL